MSLDNIPQLKHPEKATQYVLLKEHQRGSLEPIPAGTIGTLALQKDVKGELWSLPIHFENYGTYYISEDYIEEIDTAESEKTKNTE